MTDFGYSTIGASQDNPADNWVWCKATSTPAGNGTLTLIQARCSQRLGPAPTIAMALYTDSSGVPGSLVVANETPVAVGVSQAWISQTFSQAITSGTQYWFAIRCPDTNSNNDSFVQFDDQGATTELYFKNCGLGGLSAVFPATATGATSATHERWSIYGTYTPDTSAPEVQMSGPMQTASWQVASMR